jgi:hypothetical protein
MISRIYAALLLVCIHGTSAHAEEEYFKCKFQIKTRYFSKTLFDKTEITSEDGGYYVDYNNKTLRTSNRESLIIDTFSDNLILAHFGRNDDYHVSVDRGDGSYNYKWFLDMGADITTTATGTGRCQPGTPPPPPPKAPPHWVDTITGRIPETTVQFLRAENACRDTALKIAEAERRAAFLKCMKAQGYRFED